MKQNKKFQAFKHSCKVTFREGQVDTDIKGFRFHSDVFALENSQLLAFVVHLGGVVGCGVVLCGVVWWGVVWCGVLWCGMV